MNTPLLRQTAASITSSLCLAMTGCAFAWSAPLMARFSSPDSPLPMSPSESSWMASLIEAGEAVSVLPSGLLCDRWGRKVIILSSGPMVALGFLLTALTRSFAVLIIVRLIHGVALGIAYTAVPIYIAEIADPKRRGGLSSVIQIVWYAGILYAFSVGPYTDYDMYSYLCLLLPILFMITFYFMPESPYYLVMKGKSQQAKKVLSWLRGISDIDKEFRSIEEGVNTEMSSKGSWRTLFANKKERKIFLIVQIVCITKYMNGMAAITVYANVVFGEGSLSFLDPDHLAILFGVVMVVTTLMSFFFTDSFGRRPQLIYSTLGSALFNVLIGTYSYFDSGTSVDVSSYVWISYISFIGFCLMVNTGIAPLMQTIQAEYFSSQTRGLAGGLTEVIASIAAFLTIKQYQTVSDIAGSYANYWIFASISLIGAVFMYFFMPEAAGQSLVEFQQQKGERKSPLTQTSLRDSNEV